MTLISWNSTGPILKNGAIGTEAGCCCSSLGCNCDDGPVKVPASVTVVFSLGDFISTAFNGTCTHDDAVALIEGTYVMPLTAINSTLSTATYSMTTESGAEVSFIWACKTLTNNQGNYNTSKFFFTFCDLSATCFARVNLISIILYSDLLPLCEYPQNSTDDNTFVSDPARVFLEQGPLLFSCTQSASLTGRNYYYTLTITAAW